VSLTPDGGISSQGTVYDALNNADTFMGETDRDTERIGSAEDDADPIKPDGGVSKTDGKLILAEEVAEGHISWSARMHLYL
jgi:hypothetical protein